MPTAWTIVVLVVALGISWKFIGSYMEAVYERRVNWLRFIEGPIYRICGIDDQLEQGWRRYATSLVVFSGVALGFTYLILRLQGHLGLNPLHQHGVTPALAFNTSVSFVTNTNWQNYSGETTMSFFSQGGRYHAFLGECTSQGQSWEDYSESGPSSWLIRRYSLQASFQ